MLERFFAPDFGVPILSAYVISVVICDYGQGITGDLVRYFARNRSSSSDPDGSKASSTLLLIRFRNTCVLYCAAGYDNIEGDFEIVSAGDLRYLVSPHPFLHAETFRPIQFEPFCITRPKTPVAHAGVSMPRVSVIIPVYGSPLYTRNIRNEVEALLPELKALNGRVIISVDGHDVPAQTSLHLDVLEGMNADLVDVHSHDENIGFIRNVNFLYSKTAGDEIVVLLTTDVKMQSGSLARIIAPLIDDENIALSTPFAIGGENLEAPKSDALHWRDLDTILSGTEPSYPDAETNVGYLLAVDRRKYPGAELFDEFFINGYGDDSDLYYRCVNLGFRGVVADDCCVYHEHGASFDLTQKRSELRLENFRRFMERWGEIFKSRHALATATLEKLKSDKSRVVSALVRSLPMPQIVFFLPVNDRRIGGVAAVFNLVEMLCDMGLPAAVICRITPFDESGFQSRSISFDDESRRDAVLANASLLVATAHDTCEPVKKLAADHGLKTAYFVQGPEFSFSDGQFLTSVVTGYRGFDAIFVVSLFLKDVISNYVDKPITLIPYGPPSLNYYELGIEREPNSIAVQLNGNPNKGAAYVAGVVASLARKGFKIYSFGDDAMRGKKKNFCNHLGFLSSSEKVRLFNRVEFYLDASNFEGLGLLLMESIRCGAIPLYRHNGGTADILKSAGVGIEVGDYAAISRINDQLSDFRKTHDMEAERRRCKRAIEGHSVEAAAEAMLEWWNAQR